MIGAAHLVFRAFGVLRVEADADTGADVQLATVEVEGGAEAADGEIRGRYTHSGNDILNLRTSASGRMPSSRIAPRQMPPLHTLINRRLRHIL